MDTIPVAGRHDLTDEQWSVLIRAAPAGREEARTPADVDETAVHRWDPVAGPGGGSLARRPFTVRRLAECVRAVPAVAARRDLGEDPGRVAGPRRTPPG